MTSGLKLNELAADAVKRAAKAPAPAKEWRNWLRFHYDDEPSTTTPGARTFPSKELAEQAWHELNDMGLNVVEMSVGMRTEYLGAFPEGVRPLNVHSPKDDTQ